MAADISSFALDLSQVPLHLYRVQSTRSAMLVSEDHGLLAGSGHVDAHALPCALLGHLH